MGADSRGECRSVAVHSESHTVGRKGAGELVSEAQEQVCEAADTFVAELQHWRDIAGLARERLSEKMGYDPSYVGKVEGGGARPTEDFARRADQTLHAGGSIVCRWKERVRPTRMRSAASSTVRRRGRGDYDSGLLMELALQRREGMPGRFQATADAECRHALS